VLARRIVTAAISVAVGMLGLAGCAGSSRSAGAAGSVGSSSQAQPVASFSNADKDRTVTVHRGQPIQVTLDTTNWRFEPPTETRVIRWEPEAIASGSGGCIVINQCGSASITGVAMQTGHTTVHATREKCGELRRCDPSASSYSLTIVVTA
jgi:hypothetical protein